MRGNSTPGDVPGAPPPICETKKNARIRCACPDCGKRGLRVRVRKRHVRHLAHKVPLFWIVIVGVYAARCACRKFFTATIEGVAPLAKYTDAFRLVQKTRCKRRAAHMIKRACWLHVYREWLQHPLLVDPQARPRRVRRRARRRRANTAPLPHLTPRRHRAATPIRRRA